MFDPEAPHTELSFEQRVQWLRLIRTDNVGPVTFQQLLNRFGSPEEALYALPGLTRSGGAEQIRIPSRLEAESELERLDAMGGRIIGLNEAAYPPLLRFVHGPPPLLSVIGGTDLELSRTLAIVGARNASAAGRRTAATLAEQLGDNGFVVVSGLARGVDAAAHQGALKNGTVAIFAGGVDYVYPKENRELARAIVENDGLLISEMPLGTEPRARDFPRRNRLVAGLSLGTLVVEAAKRSGSLITARLALEQNREVFAIPGSPLDPRSEGTNHLIKQGATLVTGISDIIEELAHLSPPQRSLFEPAKVLQTAEQLHVECNPNESDRGRLLEALSITPTSVDDLIELSSVSAPIVQTILLELELAGRIERSAGQLVALK